jgi:DNA topoisomerase IA
MFCLIYIEDLTLWYMPAVAASALQLLMQGRLVAAFLERFFHQWVSDYTFTNDMEEQLDSISAGSLKLSQTLGVFWNKLTADLESVKDVRMQQVCVFGPGLTELF